MTRALRLAGLGEGLVSPNPLVGAVVVQEGCIVGEGFHQFALVRHAESYALEMAGPRARGAALYCNLEPCCHHGRTWPCADSIIEAGIGRVVVAIKDPDPRVSEGGFDRLRSAGIGVNVGLMSEEACRLNEIYLKQTLSGQPFVHSVSGAARHCSDGSRAGGLPIGWVPSAELRRLVRRYDMLVLGDSPAANEAISGEYLALSRHRKPIIVGRTEAVNQVRTEAGLNRQSEVAFVPLDDLGIPDSEAHAGDNRECNSGRQESISLEQLVAAVPVERVTSILVLAGPVRISEDLDQYDKVTLVLDEKEGVEAQHRDAGARGQPRLLEVERWESSGFTEISGYPSRV